MKPVLPPNDDLFVAKLLRESSVHGDSNASTCDANKRKVHVTHMGPTSAQLRGRNVRELHSHRKHGGRTSKN